MAQYLSENPGPVVAVSAVVGASGTPLYRGFVAPAGVTMDFISDGVATGSLVYPAGAVIGCQIDEITAISAPILCYTILPNKGSTPI